MNAMMKQLNLFLTAAVLAGILSAPNAGAFGAAWVLTEKVYGGVYQIFFGHSGPAGGVIDDDNAETPEQAVRRAREACNAVKPAGNCKILSYVNACAAAAATKLVSFGITLRAYSISAPGKNQSKDAKLARMAVRQQLMEVCRASNRRANDLNFPATDCDKIKTMYVASKCDTTAREDFDWAGYASYNWVKSGNYDNIEDSCPKHKPILTSRLGACRAPNKLSECPPETPLFYDGQCRAVQRQSDCTKAKPVLDGGRCRARTAPDCTGEAHVLDGGECRAPRDASECPGAEPVFDGGKCRARKPSDCGGEKPVFDREECRARIASDCGGETPVLDKGKCRKRIASDCTGETHVLDNGECRAPRGPHECPGAKPVFERGECRARIASDCGGETPILDKGECRRIQFPSDCTGERHVLDKDNGRCRAPRDASECPAAKPVFGRGECRARIASDCGGETPVFENGNCLAAQRQSDCTAAKPILDGGRCRARIAADCTGETPVFDDGECRANTAQERCMAGTEEPRRIFRKPGRLEIPGHEFVSFGTWRFEYSVFGSRSFDMFGDRLFDFYEELERTIHLLDVAEANVKSEAHRRLWARDGGEWVNAAGKKRESGRGIYHLYTPYYHIGGTRRTLRKGDVVSVLTTTDERLESYDVSREIAVFRLYTDPSGRRPDDILMALGEKPAEKGCAVSGDDSFFLTDDFEKTDDFDAAGTSFQEL